MTDKKGMTLVELMVYMVLAAMLLAPVIMLVQNSSVTMARDASNVSLRMNGREILNIIYDDLKNTGYKLDPSSFKAHDSVSYMTNYKKYAADCNASPPPAKTPENYPCPANADSVAGKTGFDISSFDRTQDGVLKFRMGRLNPNSGIWAGIDTIYYKLSGQSLKRMIYGQNIKPEVTLAGNVADLKLLYSADLTDWRDYDPANAADVKWKGSVQYIKVIMVTRDPKKLSPTKDTYFTLITHNDFHRDDGALYERHEIVIPVPNNGLFP
jgi:type II secretory pathway component PulJ